MTSTKVLNTDPNGRFLKWWYPQNTPKWSFLVGKPIDFGYHHFRNPPKYLSRRYFFFPFIQWHLLSAFFSMLRHSLGLQEGILRTRRCSLDESYPKCTCFFMSGYLHQIWSRHLLIRRFFSPDQRHGRWYGSLCKKGTEQRCLGMAGSVYGYRMRCWTVDVFPTRHPNRWQEHHFVPAISVALCGTSLENSTKIQQSQSVSWCLIQIWK